MNKILSDRLEWLKIKAKELEIDCFDINWEVVPEDVLLEVMTYALPTRMRWYGHGQSYDYQKINGEMGLSKVYEIIINSDPATAFLLDTNSDSANTLVLAHCFGHSYVYKQNYLFQDTNREMISVAASRAQRVDDYIDKYGIERVEYIMDVGYALEKNINWNKGEYRKKYAKPTKELVARQVGEFEDLSKNKNKPLYKTVIRNESFPPEPESDLLWFLINYSHLEDWEKDILEIIRSESFYFYPQYLTKVVHEGFSCKTQVELLNAMPEELLPQADYLEFCKLHGAVVQPGQNRLNINPYFLGFVILNDIHKRWDDKYKNGESTITGWQKVLDVSKNEDDISLFRNYLTQEVVDELKMFAYIRKYDKSNEEYIEVQSTRLLDVVEHLISSMYNYRAPVISVVKASQMGLELEHNSTDMGTLDLKHTKKVMQYLQNIWGGLVDLKTINKNGETIHWSYDEVGFSHDEKDSNALAKAMTKKMNHP